MKTCPVCSASYGNDTGFCPRDGSALRSGTELQPGSVIRNKYEIIGEIARGAMGIVYRARHLVWNEDKALKVLAAEGAGLRQGLKGLLAEALVMRQLQHPHIVRVEDADCTEDGQPFIVMEYIDGPSLRQRLASALTLDLEFALRIAAQTCSALSAAHQKGIIHRDIKPQNLLLDHGADGGESVKVIDFGIAKVREDAGLGFTGIMSGTTGCIVCTPAYASPEQAQGMRGSDLDGRSDVYSLGLALYEMLTGRLPFAADNAQALLVQRLHVEPMSLNRARPNVTFSPDVAGLVMKALERDRESRWRSAEEMEGAIAAVLDSRRTERGRAAATRFAAEQRPGEEEAGLAAEGTNRERQERESAQAAKAAAECGERERQQREEAETAVLAERERTQAAQERPVHEEAGRKKQDQAAHRSLRENYGGATRIRDGRKPRRKNYGIAGLVLGLAAAGFFVARYVAEKPTLEVGRQVPRLQAPKGESLSPASPLSETAKRRAGNGKVSAPKGELPARGEAAPKTAITTVPAPPKSAEKSPETREPSTGANVGAPKNGSPTPLRETVKEAAPKSSVSTNDARSQTSLIRMGPSRPRELDELVNAVSPVVDAPIGIVVEAPGEAGSSIERALYAALKSVDPRVVPDVFQEAKFKAKGFFDEIDAGNTTNLVQTHAFSKIKYLMLGRLTHDCRKSAELDPDLVACTLNITIKVFDQAGRLKSSDTFDATGPGFTQAAAVKEATAKLSLIIADHLLRALN